MTPYNSSITTPDVSEAAVKKKAIQLSKRPYVVADSSKFDKVSNFLLPFHLQWCWS